PWWIRFPVSWGLATVLIAAVLGALGLGALARTGVHGSWGIPFAILRWVGAVLLLGAAFELLVRFAPAEARPKKWVTAGTTIVVVLWIALNSVSFVSHWDPRPWIMLNLVFSTQAAYAAPLILLAQTRQADRDKTQADVTDQRHTQIEQAAAQRTQAIKSETDKLTDLITS